MKRRYLLQASAAMVGAAGLSRYLSGCAKERAVATPPFEVVKTETEWRKILTPAQFYVLRQHGTEQAGTSPLDRQYGKGNYRCVGCDLPLFASNAKFNSGTGWPSFYAPIEKAIGTSEDKMFGMTRTEVHCRRCGGHLGHVFLDGPPPTGQRYCINGVALKFVPA
ncbi:peptide-methionine (R)-S-oxide reductase MsrB [Altericista sp. CCNU0014]|uniref:peptide-methionine (R)-S-oxide reductase MsrB n=1 Tax=Altericista sp. CCNU0014 TaxID=3082949 RepID=UPI003850D54F